MKLSDIIKTYRAENNLSQREFAQRCGISHSLISILEMGVNPQTGKPSEPDLRTLRRLALGMGMTDHRDILELMRTNNAPPMTLTNTERLIVTAYRSADKSTQLAVRAVLRIPEEKNAEESAI